MGNDKKIPRERASSARLSAPPADGPPTQRALRPVEGPSPSARACDQTPSDAAAVLARLSRGERDFSGSRLAFSRFKSCSLRWAILDESDLRRSDFELADLGYASFRGSNLSGSSLAGACLEKSVLIGADLREADLRGADLSTADLTDAELAFAVADSSSSWPQGVDPVARGVFVLGGDGAAVTPVGAAEESGFTARPAEVPRYVQVRRGGVVATPDEIPRAAREPSPGQAGTNPGVPPIAGVGRLAPEQQAFVKAVEEGCRGFAGGSTWWARTWRGRIFAARACVGHASRASICAAPISATPT